MTTIHDNNFDFKKGRGVTSVSFEWNGEKVITDGQPWGGVNSSEGNITISAGRHGSKKCADWYNDYVKSDTVNMIHTLGGSNKPDKLNFAVKGTLTINGHSFDVCLGQGHNSDGNNWHLASRSITADADNKNGEIGNGIRLTQEGSHAFSLSTSLP